MAMAPAYLPGLVIHDNIGAQVVTVPLRIVRRARGNYAKHTRFDRLHRQQGKQQKTHLGYSRYQYLVM